MDLCMYVYLRILCSKNEMSSLVIFMIRLPLSGRKNILISLLIMLAFFINHLVVSGKDYVCMFILEFYV